MDKMTFFALHDDILIDNNATNNKFVLEFVPLVMGGKSIDLIDPKYLISSDQPNTLKLGDDGKLSLPLRIFNSRGKQIW